MLQESLILCKHGNTLLSLILMANIISNIITILQKYMPKRESTHENVTSSSSNENKEWDNRDVGTPIMRVMHEELDSITRCVCYMFVTGSKYSVWLPVQPMSNEASLRRLNSCLGYSTIYYVNEDSWYVTYLKSYIQRGQEFCGF